MDNPDEIISGEPLTKGTPCIVRGGYAFRASDNETPTHVCTVDCTANAYGAVEPEGT